MLFSPLIGLRVESASLVVSSDGISVSIEASLMRGEALDKATGESLSNVPWHLLLVRAATFEPPPQTLGVANFAEAMGGVDYDFPETMHATLYLPDKDFDRVVALLLAGRGIESVTLAINGLEYGPLPDGSQKVLPAKRTRLVVESYSFRQTLVDDRTDEDGFSLQALEEDRTIKPITSQDLWEACKVVQAEIGKRTETIASVLRWCLAALAAIAVATIF